MAAVFLAVAFGAVAARRALRRALSLACAFLRFIFCELRLSCFPMRRRILADAPCQVKLLTSWACRLDASA